MAPLIVFAALLVSVPPARGPGPAPMVTALAVTPDGMGYVVASQAGVRVRTIDGRELGTLTTTLNQVHALAFAPNGATLAVAGGSPAETGRVELWSWPGPRLVKTLNCHDDLVNDVVWGPDAKWLATAGTDRLVRVWDVASSQRQAELTGHAGPALALARSPDGRWLCSGAADQSIRVWDCVTWRQVRSLDNHTGAVHALAFRPAGQDDRPPLLASAGADGTVRIWQPSIGRMVRIVRHSAPVYGIAWAADGSRLCSGAGDGKLRLIDGAADTVLAEWPIARGRATVVTASKDGFLAGTTAGEVIGRKP
jgi:WD40 repeat protein